MLKEYLGRGQSLVTKYSQPRGGVRVLPGPAAAVPVLPRGPSGTMASCSKKRAGLAQAPGCSQRGRRWWMGSGAPAAEGVFGNQAGAAEPAAG